jgi:hypothetical protein
MEINQSAQACLPFDWPVTPNPSPGLPFGLALAIFAISVD